MSKQSALLQYSWQIQLRNTVGKYSWEIQLENTVAIFFAAHRNDILIPWANTAAAKTKPRWKQSLHKNCFCKLALNSRLTCHVSCIIFNQLLVSAKIPFGDSVMNCAIWDQIGKTWMVVDSAIISWKWLAIPFVKSWCRDRTLHWVTNEYTLLLIHENWFQT